MKRGMLATQQIRVLPSCSFLDRGMGASKKITLFLFPDGTGRAFKTTDAHLKKSLVRDGQHVKRGEIIGLVGSFSRSTRPHLHYEVHLNGVAVNPIHYVLS